MGPVPLVVGVTGHRDLRPQDVPALEARVGEVLGGLRRLYPHTSILLLSPLAEGADRLASRVALAHGIRLVAPLPMSKDLYEQDFEDEASLAEFRSLLDRAESWFELPHLAPEGDLLTPGDARNRQYEQVGAYIARHSQILLALWDGIHGHQIGGTSAIVGFQLNGPPAPYAPARSELDTVDSGPVYHIQTPRRSRPEPRGTPFELKIYYPELHGEAPPGTIDREAGPLSRSNSPSDEEAASPASGTVQDPASSGAVSSPGSTIDERYRRIYGSLDRFNRDAAESPLAGPSERSASLIQLVGTEVLDGFPSSLALEVYAAADALATGFRDRTRLILRVLLVCAFLAALTIQIYVHQLFVAPVLLAFYPILLGAAFGVWWIFVERGDVQNRHQDYRALAEGLRVQFFWRLSGLDDHSAADYYLRRQKSELDWIRCCLRSMDISLGQRGRSEPAAMETPSGSVYDVLTPPSHEESSGRRQRGLELVLSRWVEDQASYFASRTLQNHRMRIIWSRTAGALFVVALLTAVYAAAVGLGVLPTLGSDASAARVGIVITTLALVSAGLCEGYSTRLAYSEEAKQYERMRQVFERAGKVIRRFLAAGQTAQARRVLEDLGNEALAENGDWVLLHRSRPLEVPKGG